MSLPAPTYDITYGPDPRQRLDVFPAAKAGQPVVVFWHGGGWGSGDKQRYGYVGRSIQRMGYTAVIVGYRLYPAVRFPAFAQDGALALQWVHQHIARHQGDPKRLFLMGHSAGAHTAAHLAYDRQWADSVKLPLASVRGFIGLAGPYDFYPYPKYRPVFDLTDPAEPWRPINIVTQPAVPALLLNGRLDTTVAAGNATRMAARIRERGGSAEAIIYPYLEHIGLVICLARPLGFLPVQRDVARFIAAHS
jgi:acetyl esterase/lipase